MAGPPPGFEIEDSTSGPPEGFEIEQPKAPKSFSDRLQYAWDNATPGGPLWMAREASRGIYGAIEGVKAAEAPTGATEEEEALRQHTAAQAPGYAFQAASMMSPTAPGGGLFGVPRVAAEAAIPKRPPPLPPEVPVQVSRPDASVDLLPTDVPHELPPERRALGAAGAAGPLSDLSPDTLAHMRAVMQEQGFNANTLDDRLAEMSSHHFFGEITPSLESDMGAIAAPPGPGKLEVMGSLRQRQLEAPERVGNVFDRAFGTNENVAQLKRVMEIDRAKDSSPFYQAFRDTVVTPTDEIEALLPRLRAVGALQQANKWLDVEGEDATHGFMDADQSVTRVPTPQAFQYAKEALDDKITTAINGGERNDARRLVGLKQALINALDNHPAVGNVWQQARSTYAQPTEIMKAMDLGQRVLTNKIDPDELPFLTAGYSDPQMRALRIGMRSYLERLLGKKGTLTAETINTALSPNNVQKMRWAIGDDATDTLVNAMQAEQHMHTAQTRIWGGSPTALRLEAQKRWTAQPGTNITLSDIADAAKHPLRSAAASVVKAGEKAVAGKRSTAQEAKLSRMRDEASRIFTLQGPERDAVARYLVNGQGFARGGRVIETPLSVLRHVNKRRH